MHNRVKHVHFVGIGGAGMCGIAEVLHNLDYRVSGSDISENTNTRRLAKLGITVQIGHDPEHITGADVVVVSTAVDESNPEVTSAHENNIPVIPRAEMLAELMRFQQGIAVAGTHGKTTTTSLIASVMAEAGLDPTFVIGGKLNSADTNARLGTGEYMVVEADESDASFLHLQPVIAIVTNIDADHMATYSGDFEKLKSGFVEFIHNLPFYGLAILCIDDPVVKEIMPLLHKPVLTYGVDEEADIRALNIRQDGLHMQFTVATREDKQWLEVTTSHPGMHNVLNTLATICVAYSLEVDKKAIVSGLKNFQGINRRFQVNGTVSLGDGDVIFIDDYAHHPTEIAATLDAVKKGWPDRRIVTIFQPHRYTRTHDLFDDFSLVLGTADLLIISEIYAAGEKPITGADGRALCRAIRTRGHAEPVFIEDITTLNETLKDMLRPNDLALTLGAGNIGLVASQLPDQMKEAWQ
jgi:UDP-N-acetylmuramate--alanine ligase